ncbi:hypothetical protein [Haloferula sp.]|uniref:hypothetical protein n=1 Tax=Haloferula sp. TaxID=2497595 RepID=UPI00329B2ACE
MLTLSLCATALFGAEIDFTVRAYAEGADTIATGKITNWKRIAGFSKDQPSEVNPTRELYWAEISLEDFIKIPPGYEPPKRIAVFWFKTIHPPNTKGRVQPFDPESLGEVAWCFNSVDDPELGVMYPQVAPFPGTINELRVALPLLEQEQKEAEQDGHGDGE